MWLVALCCSVAAGMTAALEFSMVTDVNPGSGSSNPVRAASRALSARELRVVSPCSALPRRCLSRGPDRAAVFSHCVQRHALYFFADDGTHGAELWSVGRVHDGTATSMVEDIYPGIGSSNPVRAASRALSARELRVVSPCSWISAPRHVSGHRWGDERDVERSRVMLPRSADPRSGRVGRYYPYLGCGRRCGTGRGRRPECGAF